MLTRRRFRNTWDRWIVAALLVVVNLPLFIGRRPNAALVLFPDAVASGEVWRLVLHPFVHVSLYHLLLDGAAFLLLLDSLANLSPARRLAIAASAATGSVLLAWTVNGDLAVHGLCGLSGAAHGLMLASGLLMLHEHERSNRALGIALIALVSLKSLLEVATGHVLFESLHLGDVGTPNPLCHLGGVLGALGLLLLCRTSRVPVRPPDVPKSWVGPPRPSRRRPSAGSARGECRLDLADAFGPRVPRRDGAQALAHDGIVPLGARDVERGGELLGRGHDVHFRMCGAFGHGRGDHRLAAREVLVELEGRDRNRDRVHLERYGGHVEEPQIAR